MICILVSGCSNNETETTADDSEQYNESTSSTETSDDATSEASDYVDEDESLQYAYIGGLDDAMELVEAIQDKISAEDLVGISYVEYEFLYHAIDLRFYDENGYVVKTATNWYDPDPYKVYVNNYPIVVQEYYDDDDRVIIRFENFDTHVYEYNDDGFVSKETVYSCMLGFTIFVNKICSACHHILLKQM